MTAVTLTDDKLASLWQVRHDDDTDAQFAAALQSPTYTTDRRYDGEFTVGVATYQPAHLEDEPF